MIGAILGDIIGSPYEFDNIHRKDFPLEDERAFFTDDTVLTLAVAKGFMSADLADDEDVREKILAAILEVGRPYPGCGYGGHFFSWLYGEDHAPYNSFGNGSAMRVAAAGYFASSLEEAHRLGRLSAEVTHNHPVGIRGAMATAGAVFLARQGKSKKEILDHVEIFYNFRKDLVNPYYNLKGDFTVENIRKSYEYDETCFGTVDIGALAFKESVDFEDAIRNVVSIGGDCDTTGAVCGAIAGAFYGVSAEHRAYGRSKLDPRLLSILDDFEARFGTDPLKGDR